MGDTLVDQRDFDGTGLGLEHVKGLFTDLKEKFEDGLFEADDDAFAFISPHDFVLCTGSAGITKGWSTALPTLVRAATDEVSVFSIGLDQVVREAASRGLKPTSIDLAYTVATADLDDLTLELIKTTLQADGTIPTGAVIAGDADADYDSAHDTNVKRGDDTGAPEHHLLTMTIPTGDQAFQAADTGYSLRLTVDTDTTTAGVVTFYGCIVKFTRRFNDSE